jgi:PTS system nitrogen regulatory IIA component
MNLTDLFSEQCILLCPDVIDKSSALELLIKAAYSAGKVPDLYRFAEAVGARELIMSTGIGLGVAVPHAKLKEIKEFFIVLGILPRGVEWESIDEQPARLVFLIGGPEGDQTGYLKILSAIVHFAKSPSRRQKLLDAANPGEVSAFLRDFE